MITSTLSAFQSQNSEICSCCRIIPITDKFLERKESCPYQYNSFVCAIGASEIYSVPILSAIIDSKSLPDSTVIPCDLSNLLAEGLRKRFLTPNYAITSLAIRTIKTFDSCGDLETKATSKINEFEDFPLGRFMRFLRKIKLKQLLERITDPRDPEKTKHKICIILTWVFSVYFFRCESANALQTAFEKLPKHRKVVLWNYFGLEEGNDKLPDRTVVTDCLSVIDPLEINNLLEQLFKWAQRNKIFYNHMETLLPDFRYYLACDGVWVHKYAHPHATDENGNNICPYCLPRVHNKGKENEYTDWLHAFVNLAFIFPGGLQLPIYVYPLKAEQVQGNEASSDEKHKQECELQAVHEILPIILKTAIGSANQPKIYLKYSSKIA